MSKDLYDKLSEIACTKGFDEVVDTIKLFLTGTTKEGVDLLARGVEEIRKEKEEYD